MCGNTYCPTCEADAHARGVDLWARGLTHVHPEYFGDNAQKKVATRQRSDSFKEMVERDPIAASHWPEVRMKTETFRQQFAARHATHESLELLLAHVPDFMGFVAKHPFRFECPKRLSRRARLKRERKERTAWMKKIIKRFCTDTLSERMEAMLYAVRHPKPWWFDGLMTARQPFPKSDAVADLLRRTEREVATA